VIDAERSARDADTAVASAEDTLAAPASASSMRSGGSVGKHNF